MPRPIFTPVFEEDEKTIRDRMLGRISSDWRKEPGDYIYDAVAASPLEVQQAEIQRDTILKNAFAQYAEDDWLDLKLAELGLTRVQASANKRALQVTADAGVGIPKGYTAISVITDGDGIPYEFTVDDVVNYGVAGAQAVNLTCKATGAITNLPDGTEFILQPAIPGVRAIVDQGTTTPGADKESNQSAYDRYTFKLQHPDTGGNKNDYVRWTVDGFPELVGKAKCIMRWAGVGTVKVVLVGVDYQPATVDVVDAVQAYLDPDSAGQGDGKAPGGAAVTVVAATDLPLAITATVAYYVGANPADVLTAFKAAVDAYLKALAFVEIAGDPARNNVPVIIAKIGSLLIGTEGVANYSDLTLNGGTVDVPVTTEQVATRGAVTFN